MVGSSDKVLLSLISWLLLNLETRLKQLISDRIVQVRILFLKGGWGQGAAVKYIIATTGRRPIAGIMPAGSPKSQIKKFWSKLKMRLQSWVFLNRASWYNTIFPTIISNLCLCLWSTWMLANSRSLFKTIKGKFQKKLSPTSLNKYWSDWRFSTGKNSSIEISKVIISFWTGGGKSRLRISDMPSNWQKENSKEILLWEPLHGWPQN